MDSRADLGICASANRVSSDACAPIPSCQCWAKRTPRLSWSYPAWSSVGGGSPPRNDAPSCPSLRVAGFCADGDNLQATREARHNPRSPTPSAKPVSRQRTWELGDLSSFYGTIPPRRVARVGHLLHDHRYPRTPSWQRPGTPGEGGILGLAGVPAPPAKRARRAVGKRLGAMERDRVAATAGLRA